MWQMCACDKHCMKKKKLLVSRAAYKSFMWKYLLYSYTCPPFYFMLFLKQIAIDNKYLIRSRYEILILKFVCNIILKTWWAKQHKTRGFFFLNNNIIFIILFATFWREIGGFMYWKRQVIKTFDLNHFNLFIVIGIHDNSIQALFAQYSYFY